MKSFIPARRDPSFVLPGSRFGDTKFSHVIALAHLSGMKKLFNTCFQNASLKKSISAHFLDISILFLRRIWRRLWEKNTDIFIEFHHFMKKEWTQLKTKQSKQSIFLNQWESMGFCKWCQANLVRMKINFPMWSVVGWNLSRLDRLNFHTGKTESCNHHFSFQLQLKL